MSPSSPIGDAQTLQGPFITPHRNPRPAPRQQDNITALQEPRGQRWSRLILHSFRPLVLLVASLANPDISDAQTNCDACWNTVTSWQGTYSLTLTGTGTYGTGTFQINSSSQGSFTLTNVTGTTIMAGALNGMGNIDVSGSFPATCPGGGAGEVSCSVSGSGPLTSASLDLLIDTTNCTYQIDIEDFISSVAEETDCGSVIFQTPIDATASADVANATGSSGIGILPGFPLPSFGDSLTESGGNFTATTVATGGCGASGSFTLTVSWNIEPEISTGAPQFTQVPTGGSLGCNPTNIPNAQSVLDNTQATAPSGMVSVEAESVDVTNVCTVTRTFTLTATDDCSGEQAHATVAYSWTNDTNAPLITSVPPGADLGCNPATPPTDATVQAQVVAVDTCSSPTVSVSHSDATNGCTVTRTFTITAADSCGNVSPSQMVGYTWTADTTPPAFTKLPSGGNLGNNPLTVPDDATVQALTQATDDCGVASITVTHVDSGTSVFTRTFTITATDGCGNKTTTTVAYTWTGTVGGGGGTNSAPRLAISRSGTNVVLFWPANPTGFNLQSDTNLAVTNAWNYVTNAPAVSGGTNYVTNPIAGSTLFYRLFQ